jgi:hypothetical protein
MGVTEMNAAKIGIFSIVVFLGSTIGGVGAFALCQPFPNCAVHPQPSPQEQQYMRQQQPIQPTLQQQLRVSPALTLGPDD